MDRLTPQMIDQLREVMREVTRDELSRALPVANTKWVDKETAMRLLDCGETQLSRLVRDGHIRKSGGNKPRAKKLYNRQDIEAYHDKNL